MISSIKFSSKNLSHEQMKVKKKAASRWSVFGWYIQRLEGLHLIKTTIHDCCDIVCPKVSVYKWVIERFFLFWIERCCWKMKFWNRHWKQFCWKRWEFCDHIVWHVSVKEKVWWTKEFVVKRLKWTNKDERLSNAFIVPGSFFNEFHEQSLSSLFMNKWNSSNWKWCLKGQTMF